jgi:hypothetical protein
MDFFLVGAQKCATSWLYYCLRDHPELHLPSKKQEDIYLGGDLHRKHGTDWYFQHIGEPKDGQRSGGVSVDYLFDPRSPETIKEIAPGAKIIAILRDPVERAISAYYWHLRRGNVSDLDLSAGLERCLETAMAEDSEGITYDSEAYAENMILRGVYDVQLLRYIEAFGSERLFVVPMENIETAGTSILGSLYRNLHVDPTYRPSMLHQKRRPKRNSYLPFLLQLERNAPEWHFFNKVINVANQVACYVGLDRGRPSLSEDVRTALRDYYRDSVRQTFEIVRSVPSSRNLWEGVFWLDIPFSDSQKPPEKKTGTSATNQ